MCVFFGPWVLLLAGCVPGDYYPSYRSTSYDPYYRPYWDYHHHRDRDRRHKREHRDPPPAQTYTPKPSPPLFSRAKSGFGLGAAIRRKVLVSR
jgi:hypothetical protein